VFPTSPEFATALARQDRQWRSRVDVLYAGQLVQALDVLVDGAVSVDNVAVRRAAKLTLVDPTGTLTPVDAHDLLAPAGTEVRPYRGLVLASGDVEWVPLGVLGITEPEVSREDDGSTRVVLSCLDRVEAVRARRFVDPWVIAGGTPTWQAIANVVTSRLTVDTRLTQTGSTTPELLYDALSDPWDAVREMAQADGLDAYFDPLGSLVVALDEPSQTGITYTPGPGSMLLTSSRKIDASQTYSGVRVRVEHPDRDPILYELWDLDPKSPTYADGPFGRRPYGYSSPIITTLAQAQAVAATILPRVTRMRQTATLTMVGHPGHEVGDIITVNDPATRTTGDWVVTGGSVPLRATQGPIGLKLQEVVA
jgi:hypothetical protein